MTTTIKDLRDQYPTAAINVYDCDGWATRNYHFHSTVGSWRYHEDINVLSVYLPEDSRAVRYLLLEQERLERRMEMVASMHKQGTVEYEVARGELMEVEHILDLLDIAY